METVYNKFVYSEFDKKGLIETISNKETNSEALIHNAIITHFSNVVNEASGEDAESKSIITTHPIYSLDAIEKLKSESFDLGYKKAQEEFANNILQEKETNDKDLTFLSKLKEITESITVKDINDEYVSFTANLVEEVISKLKSDVPANFKQVVQSLIDTLLTNSYKKGEIRIMVNGSREEYTKQILQHETLQNSFDAIKLVIDNNLASDDCVVEYENTKLIFDRNIICNDINNIINVIKLEQTN